MGNLHSTDLPKTQSIFRYTHGQRMPQVIATLDIKTLQHTTWSLSVHGRVPGAQYPFCVTSFCGHLASAHGPLTRYVKLQVLHSPGTFSLPPRVSDPDKHQGTCVCRDACLDRSLMASFKVGSGKNIPGIPGVCATRNFTYLVRGPFTYNIRLSPLISMSEAFSTKNATIFSASDWISCIISSA